MSTWKDLEQIMGQFLPYIILFLIGYVLLIRVCTGAFLV